MFLQKNIFSEKVKWYVKHFYFAEFKCTYRQFLTSQDQDKTDTKVANGLRPKPISPNGNTEMTQEIPKA